jgi:hypothetical protein
MTTKRYIDGVHNDNWTPFIGKLWQRNYYEHIIRNNDELDRIRKYINQNPQRLDKERENRSKDRSQQTIKATSFPYTSLQSHDRLLHHNYLP